MQKILDILPLRLDAERQAASLPALTMAAEKIAASLLHGDHARRKSGVGQKFWQFRDYTQGDRPQDIDWRQSSKTDHIYIRQRELQTTQKTFFWCAGYAGMDYPRGAKTYTKRENAAILALALGLMLLRADENIGLYGQNKTGRGERQLESLGHYLLDMARTDALPNTAQNPLPAHCALILIGDFLQPLADIETLFTLLSPANPNVLILQILDPSERTLPFAGRVQFEGHEKQHREIIDNVPSIRGEYETRINAHIHGLQSLAHARGWSYALHTGGDNHTTTLQSILEQAQHQPTGRG